MENNEILQDPSVNPDKLNDPIPTKDNPQTVEQHLGSALLSGVGTLSDILGSEEARRWIDEWKADERFLRKEALKRWGPL